MSREPLRLRRRATGRRLPRALLVLAATAAAIGVAAAPSVAWPAGAFAAPLHAEDTADTADAGDTGDTGGEAGAATDEAGDAADGEADVAADGDSDAGADAELLIAPENPVLQSDTAEVRFEVLIRNPGEEPLPASTIELLADPQAVDDLAAPGGDTGGDTGGDGDTGGAATDDGAIRIPLAENGIGETPAGGEQRVSIVVPVDRLPFAQLGEPGVYAVRAELHEEAVAGASGGEGSAKAVGPEAEAAAADPLVAGSTPLIWRADELGGQAPLTVVVPLVLPESIAAMPTRNQLAELVPGLDRLLSAAEAVHATLAIDPRIVAAIRGYGLETPTAARNFLARLEASPLPMFLLQFADADPAAQSALGLEALLEPSGLEFMTRFGRFEGQTTAADDAADPAAPSLDELLAWPQGYAGSWPAAGDVDAATLGLLRAAGLNRVLLDSGNAAVSGGTRFLFDAAGSADPGAEAENGGGTGAEALEALVADAELGAAARAALTAEQEDDGEGGTLERAAGRALLAAELALRAQRQSTGAVLALDRGAVADGADPAELVGWIGELGWVTPVPESLQPVGTGALVAGETGEERRELLRAAAKRSDDIDAMAPLLVRPEYLTEYQRTRLLSTLATRYAEPGADFPAEIEERRARDEELLQGVQVVSTANTQLVSVSSQVPLQLHNSLPFDALVLLRVAPLSAAVAVPQQRFEEVAVMAEGNKTVLVPVRSRISSGDSALLAQVSDAAGEEVFSSAGLQLTIRSSFETILLSSLGAAAALLFGFGIWRSVRGRRQARRGAGEAPGEAADLTADDAPDTKATGSTATADPGSAE